MARIRSVFTDQWTDDEFLSCSPLARLLALGLRNIADDFGVFAWKPVQIKIRLLPMDNCDVTELLQELVSNNQIRFFDESGRGYGVIRNFRKWQKPQKPKSWHPLPPEYANYIGLSDADQIPVQESQPPNDANSSTGIGIANQKGGREEGKKGGREPPHSPPQDVGDDLPGIETPEEAAKRKKQEEEDQLEADFIDWYSAYPRKEAKVSACKAYRSKRKNLTAEFLLAEAKKACVRYSDTERKLIPHPATYLNQERWDDQSGIYSPDSGDTEEIFMG